MSKHSASVAALGGLGNPNVRTVDRSSGGGHGTGAAPATTGGSTPGGTSTGAPYTSRQVNDDSVKASQSGLKDNPANPHDTDEKGVLGANIMGKEAAPIDSPVPRGAAMPDRFGNYKADAVRSVTQDTPAGQPVTLPADGVLGRG